MSWLSKFLDGVIGKKTNKQLGDTLKGFGLDKLAKSQAEAVVGKGIEALSGEFDKLQAQLSLRLAKHGITGEVANDLLDVVDKWQAEAVKAAKKKAAAWISNL